MFQNLILCQPPLRYVKPISGKLLLDLYSDFSNFKRSFFASFQQFSNVSFQALAIFRFRISDFNPIRLIGPIQSIGPIHFVRSDSNLNPIRIRFNSVRNRIQSDSNLNHCSSILFPIQSNRSGLRSDSIRFNSVQNPIQFNFVSDSIQSVRFIRSDLIRFNSV